MATVDAELEENSPPINAIKSLNFSLILSVIFLTPSLMLALICSPWLPTIDGGLVAGPDPVVAGLVDVLVLGIVMFVPAPKTAPVVAVVVGAPLAAGTAGVWPATGTGAVPGAVAVVPAAVGSGVVVLSCGMTAALMVLLRAAITAPLACICTGTADMNVATKGRRRRVRLPNMIAS